MKVFVIVNRSTEEMRNVMNSYNELAIVWGEPEISPGTGKWWVKAENLTERTKNLIAEQPMCRLIIEDKREAKIELDRTWVFGYGVHRCWWLLREDVVETPFLVSVMMQNHIDDALNTDDPYDDNGGGFGVGRLDLIS